MIAVLVINHATAAATQACATAALVEHDVAMRVYLLDNGSPGDDAKRLADFAALHPDRIRFSASLKNLGFAGGMNLLIGQALADERVDQILLLNSDTEPQPGFIAAMQAKLDPQSRTDMVAARMLDTHSGEVDSLGIALYRSTLASNRKREEEILLGPSGGCALLTRRLLEDLHASHGEWFDEEFFCYAEDTDLALRARWLGYRPAHAHDAVVHHARSLSSGGPENDFVLYHGIRNSLWWLVKDAPAGWLLRSLPRFIALHGGIVLRHLRRGRARALWRLYRDAIRGIPAMRRKRAIIARTRRVAAAEFASWVEPHFYERGYVRRAWRELWRRKSEKT
ncbi:MAG: glycosyltransferase family 2 protein [Xanthomonadaceae bacterium]|nr:glycosyltransferase family 2 protein [Xanthomonadaceae bacterium]